MERYERMNSFSVQMMGLTDKKLKHFVTKHVKRILSYKKGSKLDVVMEQREHNGEIEKREEDKEIEMKQKMTAQQESQEKEQDNSDDI